MKTRNDGVLISWVSRNSDPFEREVGANKFRSGPDGLPILGPTLNILFHDQSPYRGRIRDVVLLHRDSPSNPEDSKIDRRVLEETRSEISKRSSTLTVRSESWKGDDPTDYKAIFKFLNALLPTLRSQYAGRELVIHVSPGTPSMHTVWVLMCECGFVERPFSIVKSYRERERDGRPPVVTVDLDIGVFYEVYRRSKPGRPTPAEQDVVWDEREFKSDALKKLWREASRYARINVPILILGERGTGKTTLAQWIRSTSPFRKAQNDSSWPNVPCGQYTGETIKAELFGHRMGAFTGATEDRDGLLAMADGDTLFLDEVGDMTRDVQRLLIRALEEKQYRPLGLDRVCRSAFRLITATNRSWEELRRNLDADFLDRISAITLTVPPLRESREDLPQLWRRVFETAMKRAEVNGVALGEVHHDQVVEALREHPLPGNMRDLFHVAYRLIGALADPEDRPTPAAAVELALEEGLFVRERQAAQDLARAVAGAFGSGVPLDGLVSAERPLRSAAVIDGLKRYLSEQLRRIAHERGVRIKDMCDVDERTLRNWR